MESQQFNLKDILEKSDIPAISIYIAGKEYTVLIDTGSDMSYLDSLVLKEVPKILIGYQKEIIGGTGIKDTNSAIYQVEFAFGDKEFKEEFIENDFSSVFNTIEEYNKIKLCGILGTKFLMKHKCILDFKNLVFYL